MLRESVGVCVILGDATKSQSCTCYGATRDLHLKAAICMNPHMNHMNDSYGHCYQGCCCRVATMALPLPLPGWLSRQAAGGGRRQWSRGHMLTRARAAADLRCWCAGDAAMRAAASAACCVQRAVSCLLLAACCLLCAALPQPAWLGLSCDRTLSFCRPRRC